MGNAKCKVQNAKWKMKDTPTGGWPNFICHFAFFILHFAFPLPHSTFVI
jgi:hypothetical protein